VAPTICWPRGRLGPADIAKETLISFSDETLTGWQLRQAFHDAGVSGHVTFTVNHTHTAYVLVQAGIGIGIVDAFPMLTGAFPDLVILPFRPVMQTRPHVVFSKTRAVPLVARRFAAVLQEITGAMIAGSNGMLKRPEGGRCPGFSRMGGAQRYHHIRRNSGSVGGLAQRHHRQAKPMDGACSTMPSNICIRLIAGGDIAGLGPG
jgi:hypothetical protein